MKRRWKGILWVIFLLYIGVLLRITVIRSSFGSYPLCSHGPIELVPFVGLIQIFHNSVGMFLYLFVGNLVCFVPLGVLLPVLTKARKATILWGLGLSLYIEVSQYVFGTGVSEVEDLILNTAGTGIGYLIYIGAKKLVRWKKRILNK